MKCTKKEPTVNQDLIIQEDRLKEYLKLSSTAKVINSEYLKDRIMKYWMTMIVTLVISVSKSVTRFRVSLAVEED